jgi:hypothetical protein
MVRSVELLTKLASNPAHIAPLIQDGAMDPVLSLLQAADTPQLQLAASRAFAALALGRPCHDHLLSTAAGRTGVGAAVALLSSPLAGVQLSALAAIEGLCRHPGLERRLVEEGVLLPLRHLLRPEAAPGLRLAALSAAAAAAQAPEHREAMGEKGFIPPVLRLCQPDAADGGRTDLADSPAPRPAAASPPAPAAVGEAEALAALRLLGALAQAPSNCPRIVCAGGFRVLMAAVARAGASAEAREAARGTLDSLVHLEDATRVQAVVKKAVRRMRRGPGRGEGEGAGVPVGG